MNYTITSRIDNVTRIPPSHLGRIIPPPRSVKIEVTANCNYRCSFCVKSIRKQNGEMNKDLYRRLVKEIAQAGVSELGMFYIGESFTCRWLPEAIAFARDCGIEYIFLTTNGSIASVDKIEACMKEGLHSLKFSLNFRDSAQLATVASVDPKNWRNAIENLKAARRLRDQKGYACGIFASSIKFDGPHGAAMQAVVDEILPFVDEHYWLPLYGMDGAKSGWVPKAGNPGRLDAIRDPIPCWAVFTEGHITHDGLLSACCFGGGADNSLVMADLNKVSFLEGWNSQAFQDLRQAHLSEQIDGSPCEQCIIKS